MAGLGDFIPRHNKEVGLQHDALVDLEVDGSLDVRDNLLLLVFVRQDGPETHFDLSEADRVSHDLEPQVVFRAVGNDKSGRLSDFSQNVLEGKNR